MPFITSFTWLHIFYFLMGYILISGLGNNVGLHRWAGHRAIELGKYSKNIVLYFSLMACQGHPIWWAAVHRGQHHKFSDTDKDSHSPINGKWHAFFGWELKHDPSTVNYKYAVDLMRDPILIKTSKYYEAIIITSWIIVGLFSIDLLLWMFILPTVLALHLEGMVNLFCHTKYGYRNCVNCSTEARVGGVAIANHKTGNEIQIMHKEDADRLNKLSQRQGYGVCKGMKHN